MEKFITIKNIQDCLKLKGINWDGKIGRTEYGDGEDATIEDFENGNFVPVRVGFDNNKARDEFDFLLKIYDTAFYIYEEKYHPHDDDYKVEYLNLNLDWQALLLKEHKDNYAEVLVREIDEDISGLEESFEEQFYALKLEMKRLQDTFEKEINKLKEKKKKILNFVKQQEEPEK